MITCRNGECEMIYHNSSRACPNCGTPNPLLAGWSPPNDWATPTTRSTTPSTGAVPSSAPPAGGHMTRTVEGTIELVGVTQTGAYTVAHVHKLRLASALTVGLSIVIFLGSIITKDVSFEVVAALWLFVAVPVVHKLLRRRQEVSNASPSQLEYSIQLRCGPATLVHIQVVNPRPAMTLVAGMRARASGRWVGGSFRAHRITVVGDATFGGATISGQR